MQVLNGSSSTSLRDSDRSVLHDDFPSNEVPDLPDEALDGFDSKTAVCRRHAVNRRVNDDGYGVVRCTVYNVVLSIISVQSQCEAMRALHEPTW